MVMPPSNPNFPKNLQIHPSNPRSSRYTNANQDLDEEKFGPEAQELAIRKYGIAGRVWEAAYAMTLYIQPPGNLAFDPPMIDASRHADRVVIIELGSGAGLVAFSIAKILKPGRDHLIVTDLPEVCPLLEDNLRSIKEEVEATIPEKDAVIIRPLSWGNQDDAAFIASQFFGQPNNDGRFGALTHIICSDLTGSGYCGPSILISYKIRSLSKETAFWSAFGLWFEFYPVLVKDNDEGDWQRFGANFDDTTFLFTAHRRPESWSWVVPTTDSDLLAGVGSKGTDTKKYDDTFENLLLMGVE
ncbi:hypothetical protein JR316_0006225 [Psilocybe cubensis]|uniref:Uncharacterized protein n=1 Tax=Psilocybe cubensis TaxID=181762 RepID=A0ACB8H131_PSICU|nr:hypothetical protein JR316_0006225 [Psilocybe cubensis]KAH9481698.1 hypothetical protein JR316_0006225 [Psilocybe cubensis]